MRDSENSDADKLHSSKKIKTAPQLLAPAISLYACIACCARSGNSVVRSDSFNCRPVSNAFQRTSVEHGRDIILTSQAQSGHFSEQSEVNKIRLSHARIRQT